MFYKDKVVVVTGGGNGIGREVVLQLLTGGAKVVALDISENGLKETMELAKEHGKNLLTQVMDITNKELVDALPKTVIKKFGKVDGLLNVAGIIQPFIKVNDLTFDQINKVFNVNFNGTLYFIKAFLPHLLKNGTPAFISNVSSMGGFLPVPGQSIYGASKAAVKLLTEGLYAELLDTNVRVSIVFPGAIATNITKNSNVEIKMPAPKDGKKMKEYKSLSAPKAAEIMLKGIAKNKFRILVGSDAKFMDFIYRHAPKKAVHFITKQMKDLLN